MKILFVSNSPKQTVITVKKMGDINTPNEYQTHLFTRDGGHTEKWCTTDTFEEAAYMHKQLCDKCYINVNM